MDQNKQVVQILGQDGIMAGAVPGYELRPQQIEMAKEVLDAVTSAKRLIVEAPTGTGKTLAYLVAACLSGKRVAISTGTKNLQEQLFYKDIPFVRTHIFPDLKAALLKGRGNFVCHARFKRFQRQPFIPGFVDHDRIDQINAWYDQTCRQGEGDRAELTDLPDGDPIWPEICSSAETCLGRKCPQREDCFVSRMRARGYDAHLMVINHHLLASDLAVRDAGFGEVIPRYEALIVDEAHGLEDAFTQHFGCHVSPFRVNRLCRDVRASLSEEDCQDERLEKGLLHVEELIGRLFAALRVPPGTRAEKLDPVGPELEEIRFGLCSSLAAIAASIENLPKKSEELSAVAGRVMQLSEDLEIILAVPRDENFACWLEQRERTVFLHASPVEVGPILKQRLYDKVEPTVFTSATLSSGGNFEYFKSRLGLNLTPRPEETILDSPFDYASQTMLHIPAQLPEPNSPDFMDAAVSVLERLLVQTSGRAFILFTSYRNMTTAFQRLQGKVPFPFLVQGSRPRSRLLEAFKADRGSVLFATSSFWEGVDVQGEALSCVVVDRLPFAPPNDPVVSARIEKIRSQGGEPFYSFQVPMAVLALKQGLGRLIRTRSDRGVLCILDVRIVTKPYGRIFLDSLHQCPISRDAEDVERFFALSVNHKPGEVRTKRVARKKKSVKRSTEPALKTGKTVIRK